MATKQSLKGNPSKVYEIVNTFNKGYNTSVADDLLSENVFRNMSNFLPSTEGNVTKRPGINRTKMYEFFNSLSDFNNKLYKVNITGNTNDPNITSSNSVKLPYLFSNLFEMADFSYKYSSTTVKFVPETLSNLTIFDDNNLNEYLNDFTKLLNYEDSKDIYEKGSSLDFVVIFYGQYTESIGSSVNLSTHGLRIIKLSINLYKSLGLNNIAIKYEIRQPFRKASSERVQFRYEGDSIIDFAIYADNYYFMNGYDAIVKVTRDINSTYSADSIREIYKSSSLIYKPTAIEVSNIGFNILAENPLEYIKVQGAATAIRGVFYTYEGEPIQTLPYNKPFKIHILSSGSGTIATPQYRVNNGEIDEEKNAYKNLKGAFSSSNSSIFECTGIDETSELELKFTKGEDTFLAYVSFGSLGTSNLGKISDISQLVLSSKYCKVINNQLVLYGNHGYLFFSEYDNFEYFPNYNNIYVAETENEYAVSINYFRQYYAIFTNRRIKRMTGTFGSDDFGIYPLNDFIGCINPKTIRQIQNYLYFLSYNGLYILKQGYLGEGTENVEQIDLPIYNSYSTENMLKGYTLQNYYALYSKSDALLYNFTNEAFYKLKTADVAEAESLDVNETRYSIPFQYNKLQNDLLYGIRIKNRNMSEAKEISYNLIFDICCQDFSEEETERTDNGLTFVSTIETPAMSLGTPTNTKKFKEIYLKIYNSYGKNIPLYVTIKVDDKVVISPKNYEINYDNDTNTYYYVEKIESNKTLKGYNVLGTMILGEDPLGERTMQILKLRVGAKGRAIKIILSDGISQGEKGYSPNQNKYRFDLSTIGVVYKLKKVKEG